MEKNTEKQERYRILLSKLKKAIANSFWFEACMIEYAIIEDRTSSILSHSQVCKDAYNPKRKLGNKLNSIELQIGKKHPIISKKVNPDTIKDIKTWKEERNDLVHRACTMYNEDVAKGVAEKGQLLAKAMISDSSKVTKLADKLEKMNETANM